MVVKDLQRNPDSSSDPIVIRHPRLELGGKTSVRGISLGVVSTWIGFKVMTPDEVT
jgi:hypothetical protein